MKKIIGVCLALCLAFSFVACGGQSVSGNNEVSGDASITNDTEVQNKPSEPEQGQSSEQEEQKQENEPTSDSEETAPEGNGEQKDEQQEQQESEPVVITASHSDVTFKVAGSSFKLTLSEVPEDMQSVTYVSRDELVATVAEDGTVTAVAPGTTNVVMILTYTDGSAAEFDCIIRCSWHEESVYEGETDETNGEASTNVDLAAFFVSYMENLMATLGEENTPHTMAVEGELLDAYYAGLGGIATRQCVVQMPGIGAVPFEFALIEVENTDDVTAVQTILKARVTYQVEGGAWYPATIEGWEKAEIIVIGNYIALIVAGEQQADAVAAFNALFN